MSFTTELLKRYIPENVTVETTGNVVAFAVPVSAIEQVVTSLYGTEHLSLKSITATDERHERGCFRVWYIFSVPGCDMFLAPFIELTGTTQFPSLTPVLLEARHYERKIATFFGLTPVGHPDSRPLILHENWPADVFPLRKDFNWKRQVPAAGGSYQFQKVDGEGIYEIPVGPIHAGIIEPGHFRFSVAGEEILLLEPRMGYTHKGVEKLFEVLPFSGQIGLAERISGDSSFSHSLAYCQALETLAGLIVPERARYLRVIGAEFERLANHLGDIGAIMVDTGFNFGGAQGARLRERMMRLNEQVFGSRFLRGVNTVGGVIKDVSDEVCAALPAELADLKKDFSEVIAVAEESSSLLNRLRGTGTLPSDIARERGVVGVPAKAIGIAHDTRVDFPYAAYKELGHAAVITAEGGDVYARFCVRIGEVYQSLALVEKAILNLPAGGISVPFRTDTLAKNARTVALVEGWRGEIVYFVTTNSAGAVSRVAPRDPSFVNWAVLGSAGPGNIVPDFPLINKSFNLSYSGNDL